MNLVEPIAAPRPPLPPHTNSLPFKANFGSFLSPENHPRCLSLVIRAACLQPSEAGGGVGWGYWCRWPRPSLSHALGLPNHFHLKLIPQKSNSGTIGSIWSGSLTRISTTSSRCKLAPPSGRRLFEPCIYDQ